MRSPRPRPRGSPSPPCPRAWGWEQRVGRLDVARGHQWHGRRWHPGSFAGPGGGQPHRGHGLLGLLRLPGGPGSTTFGLVGQVAENPPATAATTYSFTDTGATAERGPKLRSRLPHRHQPRHRLCQQPERLAAGHQHVGRLLHRTGDRPEPGFCCCQRTDQLHPGRYSHG